VTVLSSSESTQSNALAQATDVPTFCEYGIVRTGIVTRRSILVPEEGLSGSLICVERCCCICPYLRQKESRGVFIFFRGGSCYSTATSHLL